jgi:hypothetical protein
MHQGAPATGPVIASAARPVWNWIRVNRSFYFAAFVFLLLFALLLLLSGQLGRFSVPRSTRESGEAIDRAAVEKSDLNYLAGSDKARSSARPAFSIRRIQKTLLPCRPVPPSG